MTEAISLDYAGNKVEKKADPVQVVAMMLDLLWTNQTDRHGVAGDAREISQGQTEDAVHLALTLVRLFQSGAVTAANLSG
jgi:hypothetical protein